MVDVNKLNGNKLKKDLNLKRAFQRYHNEHKDNSGNIGYTFVDKQENKWTLDIVYGSEKETESIRFGTYGFGGSSSDLEVSNYKELIEGIKSEISEE